MSRSLGCAACGRCCEQIYAGPLARIESQAEWFDRYLGLDDQTMAHLWATSAGKAPAILDWREARDVTYRNANGVRDLWQLEWVDDLPRNRNRHVYTCRAYDPQTRQCTVHDERRPHICDGFPFYGLEPSAPVATHTVTFPDREGASCSYWLDVPGWADQGARPLLPLTVLDTRKEIAA